jgi:hypothetical protein
MGSFGSHHSSSRSSCEWRDMQSGSRTPMDGHAVDLLIVGVASLVIGIIYIAKHRGVPPRPSEPTAYPRYQLRFWRHHHRLGFAASTPQSALLYRAACSHGSGRSRRGHWATSDSPALVPMPTSTPSPSPLGRSDIKANNFCGFGCRFRDEAEASSNAPLMSSVAWQALAQ